MTPDLLAILCQLAEPSLRVAAAAELARRVGVESVLFFVRDPELGTLLPPLGFPQTAPGGPVWRAFLRSCTTAGTKSASVDFPAGAALRSALAVVHDHGAIVLLGGTVDEPALAALTSAIPLVGAIFRAEHAATLARGEAAVARTTGRRAHDLAVALDAARGDVERALEESARLNAELKADDRRKDEFLAMLSHELRNPLAAIVAASAVMRDEATSAESVDHARAIVERQTAQLTRLVDDLLDLARVTRGKIQLRLEAADLVVVVRRAIDGTQAIVAARGHDLELSTTGPVTACVDLARVEQMVTNLLTNAAKYMDPGGHIRVAVAEEAGEAIVSVEDAGIGIDADALPAIFDPFVQITPAIDRGAGGLGVGLTLVRQLATLHGGSVQARSQPGIGSVFTLRFPLAEAAPAAPALPASARGVSAKKRVLIVDDNIDAAEMLVMLTGAWGHAAEHAADGPTAVAMATASPPDVVLLDIGLPGMDGYEVAARLRTTKETAHARIVAVSGYGHAGDLERSRAAGCDEHLVKPVDLVALRRAIER